MASETYIYNGVEYTLSELARLSGMRRDTIQHRLKIGCTIEEALEIPLGSLHSLPALCSEDIGKQVTIVFKSPPPVLASMQPILGKKYTATICGTVCSDVLRRVFYTILLDNGKTLVTYPGEFEQQPS